MESEQQLILRVLERDPQAEEDFLHRYEGLMLGLAQGRFGLSRGAAEEVRQELMAKLWARDHRALRAWRGRGKLTTYLSVILTHLCLARRERECRRPEKAMDLVELPHSDPSPGSEESLLRREQAKRLEEAKASLSARDQLLLALRFGDERSPTEIAGLLGLGVGTARKAIHDALGRLRRRLRVRSPELFPHPADTAERPGKERG